MADQPFTAEEGERVEKMIAAMEGTNWSDPRAADDARILRSLLATLRELQERQTRCLVLNEEERRMLLTAISDVWVIRTDDSRLNAATLLWQRLRTLGNGGAADVS
jgi:aminoglycoside phosphotransferase